MRVFCFSSLLCCVVLGFSGQTNAETLREEIRAILEPCGEGASFRELSECLQARTKVVAEKVPPAKAQELQTIAAACKASEDTDAAHKDEIACMVQGVANVADNVNVRDYAYRMCAQRSFSFHAQCLFTVADNTTDELLRSIINSCRSVSGLAQRSQCLIDKLVKITCRRGPSPFVPWWWQAAGN